MDQDEEDAEMDLPATGVPPHPVGHKAFMEALPS
jgi:hypothetical protein